MLTATRHRLLGRRPVRRPELPRRPRVYQGRSGTLVITGLHRTRRRLSVIRSAAVWLRRGTLLAIVLVGVSPYLPPSPWTGWAVVPQDARRTADASLMRALEYLTALPALDGGRPWLGHLAAGGRLHVGVWGGLWLLTKAGGSLVVYVVSRPGFAWAWPRRLTVKMTRRSVWVWRWGIVPWRFPHRQGVAMIFRRIDLPPEAMVISRPMSPSESRDVARRQRVLADTARVELIYGSRRVLLGEILGLIAAERFVVCLAAAQSLADEIRVARPVQAEKPKMSQSSSTLDAPVTTKPVLLE